MLGNDLTPVLLAHSALKIEKDFSPNATWNFKIVTPDGIQYYFGGSNATEKTNKYQTNCGKTPPAPAATAWYLTQVIHPYRDTVMLNYSPRSFLYETGANETMYSALISQNVQGQASPPTMSNSDCQLWMTTNSVILQEINSASGGRVKFFYQNRSDVGDQLLSRIEMYKPSGTMFYRFFGLSYLQTKSSNYGNSYSAIDTALKNRPFLVGIAEGGSDGVTIKSLQQSIFVASEVILCARPIWLF